MAIYPPESFQELSKEQILEYMCSLSTLSAEESEVLVDNMSIQTFEKGTLLLREGDLALDCYYTLKGCVRKYYLQDGEEKTVYFYTEEESISSYESLNQKKPAKYYLECVEETTLSIVTPENERAMYKRLPRLETLCREGLEIQLGMYEEMMASYMMASPEQRYMNLVNSRPDLVERVPQYQLASYIGVTPESLSRIRKRIAKKERAIVH